MCTVSWLRRPEGYELFFNRDERRARRRAEPPALRRKGPSRFIAPLDGNFGGSWIAANQHGLSLFLLNGYAPTDPVEPEGGFTSRGLLLTGLADGRSAEQIERRLRRYELDRFRSFLLAVLEPSGGGLLARWSNGSLDVRGDLDACNPLVSSSFDGEEVRASRREQYRRMVGGAAEETAEAHLAFHESHAPERGPHSPCMHRPDAETVSFSHVRVDAQSVRFDYTPHSPCRGRPEPPPVTLARA